MGFLEYLARAGWVLVLMIVMFGRLLVATTDPEEIQALLALKASLSDPDNNLGNWKAGTDPCDNGWTGVVCMTDSGDRLDHVTEIGLLRMNLGGQLGDELGRLPALEYLDLMWNNFSGRIPASLGNLVGLKFLLMSGNQFSGELPPELGKLVNMGRLQLDENRLSGPIPDSFVNLTSIKHFHMNNNSFTGTIPEGFGSRQNLLHILLDNNNMSGSLPPDLAQAPNLRIIQLDNNKFTELPPEYTQIPTLVKLSMRNCGLQGTVPDLSGLPRLVVLDLSNNDLTGQMSNSSLPVNLSAMDLGNNRLNGSVPESIGNLKALRYLELRDNQLSGEIPSNLGTGASFSDNATDPSGRIVLDFQNNSLSLSRNTHLVTLQSEGVVELWLNGNPEPCPAESAFSNPLCKDTNVASFLGGDNQGHDSSSACSACKAPYENAPAGDRKDCRCVEPITVRLRLKSPSFTSFDLYEVLFIQMLASELLIDTSQVKVKQYTYEPGPRISILIFLFPKTGKRFENGTEVDRMNYVLLHWDVPDNFFFGPYEVLQFSRPEEGSKGSSKGLSAGALAGVVIAGVLVTSLCAAVVTFWWMRKHGWNQKGAAMAKRALLKNKTFVPINVPGVKAFTFEEMTKATENFDEKNVLGKGGYGKVYLGTLKDGTVVAVKRAAENSLQGSNEFETEILLMSRVHHRNLVGLLGYCQDEGEYYSRGEQMLVYEYMPNGNLRHHLDKDTKGPMDFATRLRVALGSARGIQYLHTQADPPIFHRDIKAANILLDEKFNARVSDFGLSKLAPTDVSFEGTNEGHVTTMVKGTFGYLDPDYFLTQKLTDKSDVYSFGVVMLEIMSGRYPVSMGKNLLREVTVSFKAGLTSDVLDSRMGPYPASAAESVVELALACCKDNPQERPSMTEVLHGLEDIWKRCFATELSPRTELPSPRGLPNRWATARMDSDSNGYYANRPVQSSNSTSFNQKTIISPR